MLKSVFLIRVSLVIPNVSLNLPKDELFAIYIYCAYTDTYVSCVCTHTYKKYALPGLYFVGRVPLVFATRIILFFSLSLFAANPN